MKWLILLTLFACSSQDSNQKTEEKPERERIVLPTPSEAKPVKSCICNKIYMPVCANGQTYGNSCEAQCQGHKKWTEGSCSQ